MTSLRIAVLVLLLALARPQPGTAQAPAARLIDYVVQSVCVDDAGRVIRSLPIDPECVRTRLQRSDDVATYRKHDWPNTLTDSRVARGYQASDSVTETRSSKLIVIQTFDFGTDGRQFGHFDRGRGDGGQVLLFVGEWASFAMTEDGSGGVQWFIGETCRSPVDQNARFLGWLAFPAGVNETRGQAVVAKLNITTDPGTCPGHFNDALTRYWMDRVEFPFRVIEGTSVVRSPRRELEVIVSEHYGGTDIVTADHLERFFFARSLGLVRWERWANGNLRQPPGVRQAQRMLGQTARCPHLDRYGAPDPKWLLVDCRTWTALVRQDTPWSVQRFDWPALAGFGPVN
jgi:hypothetical protein